MSTVSRPVPPTTRSRFRASFLCCGLLLCAVACDSDNDSAPPPIGTAPEPEVGVADNLPGVVVGITGLSGGTGANGNFRVGDTITVAFTAATKAGEPLELSTMARGAIFVSGPTSNYQRVIGSQADVLTAAVKTALGAYTYTFPVAIPATYLAPLNDTTALTAGEMTGQDLLSGTYTVGIELRKDYTVDGTVYRDPGNTTADFLFGSATDLAPREVVTMGNCNQCHTELRAHGNNRNDVTTCLLCHTSGSEDRNTPSVAGGTPGVTIDFKVMIHKIHSGAHLPSVLGVGTNPDGSRNYTATAQPYEMIGYGDSLIDFSDIIWPAWPSFYTPMPRDTGFSLLSSTNQGLENTMRRGPTECWKCHGDPDGDGPLPAPAQGDLVYAQPTTAACASCHDDWDPAKPYTANLVTMPRQDDDVTCKLCHTVSGDGLAVMDAHRHPLVDEAVVNGVHFVIESLTDAGGDNDGTFDAGERVRLTFRIEDDDGAPIAASSLASIETVLSGPTQNPQMVNYIGMPPAYFSGNGPYTVNMPEPVYYEPIGTSTGTLNTWTSSKAPIWNITNAATTVFLRTATGISTSLAAAAPARQNFIDVATGAGASFVKDNYIVLEDAVTARREYMKIQYVQGDRLWFGSEFRTTYKPNLLFSHPSGSTVTLVTLTSVAGTSYTLDPATGLFSEVVEFGAGEVLASYTSDFVVPSVYPGALDDSPVNGEDWGDWTGLAVLAGTYTFDIHGSRSHTVVRATESTTYTQGADSTWQHVLFGDATTVETTERTVGESTCYVCHNNLQFHGGRRRSYVACIQCHGTAGAENTLIYENQTTGNPLGTSVEFRYLAHELHDGAFPAMPGGVMDCAKCHGAGNTAWVLPADREHPNQTVPTRAWRAACSSCHNEPSQVAHIDANTSPAGAESCAICHGEGDELNVRTVHTVR